MTEDLKKPYYCSICKKVHRSGKIYEDHREFFKFDKYDFDLDKIENILKDFYKFIPESIEIPKNSIIIQDLTPSEIVFRIEDLFNNLIDQVNNGLIPSIELPLRGKQNIVYNQHGNPFFGLQTNHIELGDEKSDFLRILRVAELTKQLLTPNLHATKREIFYNDANLFQDQKLSDKAIEDLSLLLKTYRKNLNIVASAKGTLAGMIRIRDRNEIIDIERLGPNGWMINPLIEKIEILESTAKFIIVLEKDAAMIRLSELPLWDLYPCILFTSQGYPNYATRELLRKLVLRLKIPVFGLADSDPYGLSILMNYAYGSVQSANETARLAVNNFYWLGLLCKDIEKYNIPSDCQLPLTQSDIKRAQEMLLNPVIQIRKEFREELELMLEKKKKCEIQALSYHGFQFLVQYIIDKIQNADLMKF